MALYIQNFLVVDNGDVVTYPAITTLKAIPMRDLLLRAHSVADHILLSRAGGESPADYYSFAEFEQACLTYEELLIAREKTAIRKRTLVASRRSEFNSARAQLELQMIAAGSAYICQSPGCGESENLTIDHIVPLSKGGSDDLENLQFLCRSHNSQKGDST